MPGGGFVITFSDVTPSFEAAEALERANATLEKRVRDRTEELTRLNSELARAKSTAEDANISKTRFLAAASHDILQPLNAARLYVTSLVERQSGGEDARLVENIDDSLEAIEEILGALLDISRLDAGAMTTVDLQLQDGRPDALARDRVCADRARQGTGADLRALLAAGAVRSPAAAAAAAEPDLQRHQIHPARARAGRLPPPRASRCRSASTIPASAFPCRKRGEIFKEFHRLEQGARIARGLGLGLSIVERLARVLNHGIAIDANRQRRLGLLGDGAGGQGDQSHRRGHQRDAAVEVADVAARSIVCIENDAAILDGMKTLLTGLGTPRSIAVADPEAAIARDRRNPGRAARHRPAGRLSSRPRQRRRRDPRNPPPLRRRTFPAILITADRSPNVASRPRARSKHRGPEQAGEAGLAARPARAVATQQMVAAEAETRLLRPGREAVETQIRRAPDRRRIPVCARGALRMRRTCWFTPSAISRATVPPAIAAAITPACGSRRRASAGSPRHAP